MDDDKIIKSGRVRGQSMFVIKGISITLIIIIMIIIICCIYAFIKGFIPPVHRAIKNILNEKKKEKTKT